MTLQTQATAAPSRKMWAVIVAGVVVGAIQGGLSAAFPDADFTALVEQAGPWITAAVMSIAGYMTRDREVNQ